MEGCIYLQNEFCCTAGCPCQVAQHAEQYRAVDWLAAELASLLQTKEVLAKEKEQEEALTPDILLPNTQFVSDGQAKGAAAKALRR